METLDLSAAASRDEVVDSAATIVITMNTGTITRIAIIAAPLRDTP
jgi:hypothetical protein